MRKLYKITIEKITSENKLVREWLKIHNKEQFDSEKDPQYKYITIEKEVAETKEIYTQLTDKEIDIKKVIDAFNQ